MDALHCQICGSPTQAAAIEGRERRRCATCGWVHWLNPASAAAGLVLWERRVLLVRRAIAPCHGMWALPAGFQEIDEPAALAVEREVREECGIAVRVGALHDLVWVPEGHRPANVAVYRCTPLAFDLRPGPDVLDAAWFSLDQLPLELAFSNGPRILWPLRDAHGPAGRDGAGGGAPPGP
jgi:ADP-ribose pyrophosphatase YjhB (NUDIX family)